MFNVYAPTPSTRELGYQSYPRARKLVVTIIPIAREDIFERNKIREKIEN